MPAFPGWLIYQAWFLFCALKNFAHYHSNLYMLAEADVIQGIIHSWWIDTQRANKSQGDEKHWVHILVKHYLTLFPHTVLQGQPRGLLREMKVRPGLQTALELGSLSHYAYFTREGCILVLVGSGCHHDIPHFGWRKRQKSILAPSWCWKFGFWDTLHVLQLAAFWLCPSMMEREIVFCFFNLI